MFFPLTRNWSHLTLIILLSTSFYLSSAQSVPYDTLVKHAAALYDARKFKPSLKKYEQAFAIRKDLPVDLYNGACSAALANKKKKAIKLLNEAIRNGYHNTDHIQKDADLLVLHPTPDWTKIIAAVKENETKYSDPAVLERIKKLLLTFNQSDALYNDASDSLKRKTSPAKFKKTVDDIYTMINRRRINSFNVFALSTSHSTHVANKDFKNAVRRSTYTYQYLPPIFDHNIKSRFRKEIGYKIEIEMKRSQQGILVLNDLRYTDQMIYGNKDVNQRIKEFLFSDNSYNVAFTLDHDSKEFGGNLKAVPRQWNIPDDIRFDYEAGLRGDEKKSTQVYTLSLWREIPDSQPKEPKFGDISVFFNQYEYLEIAYFPDIDISFISFGDEFGFYKINRPEVIRDLLQKLAGSVTNETTR